MFNRILVPLDGSALAEGALAHAEQFARAYTANIILLQVMDPSPYRDMPNQTEPLNWQIHKAEAEMYLQEVAGRLRKRNLTVEYALREGRTAENIIDFAHSENINLLVLSSHGSSGLSRWNNSSITTKVIDKIYLPILLVRSFQEQPANGQESESAPKGVHYQRILLPIDSSRRAECALPAATALIQSGPEPEKASLLIAAVIRPPELPLPAPYPEEIQQQMTSFLQLSRSAVENYLKELQARTAVHTEVRVVENSNIATAIHDLAEQEDVDLVVLCAHGQTGRFKWPYGSVTRNYIEHGVKPVLVIQDVPREQLRPTAAEVAAEKYGRR